MLKLTFGAEVSPEIKTNAGHLYFCEFWGDCCTLFQIQNGFPHLHDYPQIHLLVH